MRTVQLDGLKPEPLCVRGGLSKGGDRVGDLVARHCLPVRTQSVGLHSIGDSMPAEISGCLRRP